jgi:hypothetical protein
MQTSKPVTAASHASSPLVPEVHVALHVQTLLDQPTRYPVVLQISIKCSVVAVGYRLT